MDRPNKGRAVSTTGNGTRTGDPALKLQQQQLDGTIPLHINRYILPAFLSVSVDFRENPCIRNIKNNFYVIANKASII